MKKIWFVAGLAAILSASAPAVETGEALLADIALPAPQAPEAQPEGVKPEIAPEPPAPPPEPEPETTPPTPEIPVVGAPEIAPNPELDLGEIEAVAKEAQTEKAPEGALTEAVTQAVDAPPPQPNILRHWHNVSYGYETVESSIAGISFLCWGAPNYRYSIDGLRLSIGGYSHQRLRGVDIGLLSVITKDASGLQINLFHNDVQRTLRGVQIGLYNKTIETRGLQIGFLNVTDNLKGVQIGVINISQYIGLPLINIAW